MKITASFATDIKLSKSRSKADQPENSFPTLLILIELVKLDNFRAVLQSNCFLFVFIYNFYPLIHLQNVPLSNNLSFFEIKNCKTYLYQKLSTLFKILPFIAPHTPVESPSSPFRTYLPPHPLSTTLLTSHTHHTET